jgi:phosphoglycerate dehydrogenase-like enzyme
MNVVISVNDPPAWVIPAGQVERIAAALPADQVVHAPDRDGRRRALAAADVALTTTISAEEFALAPRLRWIHSTAVGVARLLLPAVVASDVIVSNSRGVHSHAIAEHAIALVLALRRRLHVAAARQHERRWAQLELADARVAPLDETTLVVVGLGTIGTRVAALASGLGMRVVGVRKRLGVAAPPGVAEVLPVERLAEALPQADAIVLAIPRTHDNRVLLGASELALMRPTALVVNVARGQLVDETALVAALEAGRLGGAGLDAFQQEPLPAAHRLWALPNVLVTPHSASFAGDYWAPVVDLFLANVERFRRGEPLVNVVEKDRGY